MRISFHKKSLSTNVYIYKNIFQDHNARQLPIWCLHFIAKNYATFQSRQEFSKLTGNDLAFVEKHQWPPSSYLQELARYEAERAEYEAKQKKCVIMWFAIRVADVFVQVYFL